MSLRLEPSPAAGNGVRRWLLSQANRCRIGGLQPATTALCLRDAVGNCGRVVPDREIEDAVRTAFAGGGKPGGRRAWNHPAPSSPAPPRWPKPDAARITQIGASGFGLVDLWEASPVRLEDNESHTEAIIDALFPGDPLLCGGWSQYRFDTRHRSAWRGELSGLQLVVPSPMASEWGLTKEGKASKHSQMNTGSRRFLVVEFDHGLIDHQAALLLHLGQFAPLVLAVHSGGKSIHGWFLVAGQPEDKIHRFFRYAVVLGADPALWSTMQFARMPDGTRENGRRQTVYFLSFGPLQSHA